jgi:hypothetical protein
VTNAKWVWFDLDAGAHTEHESNAPYAMNRNSNTDIFPWPYTYGAHTLNVTAGNDAGTVTSIFNFMVVATASPSPSAGPNAAPTIVPTEVPTNGPSVLPTEQPTMDPTYSPTSGPTSEPSASPTSGPTLDPSSSPSGTPSLMMPDVSVLGIQIILPDDATNTSGEVITPESPNGIINDVENINGIDEGEFGTIDVTNPTRRRLAPVLANPLVAALSVSNDMVVSELDSNVAYQAAIMLQGITDPPRNDITVHVSWTAGTLHSFDTTLPAAMAVLLPATDTFYPVGFGEHHAVITVKFMDQFVLDTFEICFEVQY